MTSDHEFSATTPDNGVAASDPERNETDSVAEPSDAEVTAQPGDTAIGETREPEDPATTLSPSVRRLVRQYDLDVTGIHGTGPSGRIRVGDVIGLLGARGDASPDRQTAGASEATGQDSLSEVAPPYRSKTPNATSAAAPAASAVTFPLTTVFECDLSRVLSHRKRRREEDTEALLTSYYVVACSEASKLVPEAAASVGAACFGVLLEATDGTVRTVSIDSADEAPLGSIDDRLQAVDRALRAGPPSDLASATLLVHHHGTSGSLIATPTPIGDGHSASLGIGRVRREIVVRTVNGEEAPRVAALCYVSLSFYADRLDLYRANRFLGQLVRVLEQWP
jgi:pyruvate/2-oxoglutarate dehydrogenase complex dihydrolipoamide acyltransferase (E2) component